MEISLRTRVVQMRQLVQKRVERLVEDTSKNKVLEQSVAVEADMIKLVDTLLVQAVACGASDIHIEPYEIYVRIRYRVDGVLREQQRLAKEGMERLVARIKIMAKLDIGERRLPQDGRMQRDMDGHVVDFRINIVPTLYGEKVTIRLLYLVEKSMDIDKLGFSMREREQFEQLLNLPHGMLIFTGPTGCGKSTTMAVAIERLNDAARHLITIEDPIEKYIEGVNQLAVQPKIGLTFATCLRAILRQDPDVIMVGEMRDEETAQIAIRAAVTGHFVLTTLHTNDTISAITRLVDMGVAPYLVGGAVKGVMAQRLLRRICPQCKVAYGVDGIQSRQTGIPVGTMVYHGVGCGMCNHTGYKGRFAVQEVLVIQEEVARDIASGKWHTKELGEWAKKSGMRTLWDNGYASVLSGETTIDELLKIALAT